MMASLAFPAGLHTVLYPLPEGFGATTPGLKHQVELIILLKHKFLEELESAHARSGTDYKTS